MRRDRAGQPERKRGCRFSTGSSSIAGRDTRSRALLAGLKRQKKFAKATHNTWAAILDGEPVKDDDGEAGAGALILQMLDRAGLENHVVVVTRWYGGKQLGGDRFRHVADAVRLYLRETGLGDPQA